MENLDHILWAQVMIDVKYDLLDNKFWILSLFFYDLRKGKWVLGEMKKCLLDFNFFNALRYFETRTCQSVLK